MKLAGKTVLITGGGQGMAKGLLIGWPKRARISSSITSVIRYQPMRTVAKIQEGGRKALAVEADISSVDQIHSLMKQAIDYFGAVDVLLNNAGVEKHSFDLGNNRARLRPWF